MCSVAAHRFATLAKANVALIRGNVISLLWNKNVLSRLPMKRLNVLLVVWLSLRLHYERFLLFPSLNLPATSNFPPDKPRLTYRKILPEASFYFLPFLKTVRFIRASGRREEGSCGLSLKAGGSARSERGWASCGELPVNNVRRREECGMWAKRLYPFILGRKVERQFRRAA